MIRQNHFSLSFWVGAVFFIITMLAGCNLQEGGAGPAAWIDRPLDGDEVPFSQAVTIQAHASDADGVASFEFFVFENPLGVVPASGERLGEASLEWQPPEPGVYLLGVRAEDTQGNQGSMVSIQITFTGAAGESDNPAPETLSEQCAAGSLVAPELLSPPDGATVEAPPLLSWSYPDPACNPFSFAIDISSDASFSDISLGFGTQDYTETSRSWPLPDGQCYYWRTRAYVPEFSGPPSAAWSFCIGAEAAGAPTLTLSQNANCRLGPGTVYEVAELLMQGQVVAIEGRNTDSNWFWVQKPSASGHCWVSLATGEVAGDTHTVPLVSPPPAPVDTTPPDISNLGVNPALISVQTQCGATPATTTITARIADAGGIQRAVARIPGVGEFDLISLGGNEYQVVLGPFSEAGTLSIFIQAQDKAGNNAASSPLTIQVVTCPD